jgi:HD-like signal output (HDOD) protein
MTTPVEGKLWRVMDQLGTLAGGAITASRLLATACSPDPDLRQLRKLIEGDPGLMLRVLRVANSAFYGQPRKIGSIDRAVTVLGIEGVRVIAAAACLDHALPRAPATRELSAALHRHSLCCGVTARISARTVSPDHSGEAFIGGLLHDIGCGLLMLVDAERYVELTQRRSSAAREDRPLDVHAELRDEQQFFGMTQWEATITLADRWKLPGWFSESLTHDGGPVRGTGDTQRLADCVRWAERTAGELGYTNAFQLGMLIYSDAEPPLPEAIHAQILAEAPAEIDVLRGALMS